MTHDMTDGNAVRQLIRFSVPVMLGLLLQQLYNMADTAIVGHTLGALALGGVGSTGSLNFLIIGFCSGLCAGMALPAARTFGAKDYSEMRRFIANSVWVAAVLSLVLLAVVLPLTGRILHLMHTPEEQFRYAYTYIFIVFCGIPATITYNLSSGILRALGDSRTPLLFLLLASVVNMGLDLLLIIAAGLGVAGAAIATVSAQLLSGICCILYMKKHFDVLKYRKGETALRRGHILSLLSMGVPMGLQFSVTAIGSVILQSSVNSLGALYVSAQSAAMRVNSINTAFYDGIGSASANFTSQNLGAGRFDRIRKGAFICSAMCGVIWLSFTALVLLAGDRLALIFVSREEAAQIGRLVFLNSLCYAAAGPLLTMVSVFRNAIQGLGFSAFSILAGVMELIGRAVIGIGLIPVFGYIAACFASPLAWLLADFFLVPGYLYCLRRVQKTMG